jgi:hypothetical protein
LTQSSGSFSSVPELTCGADIKLNERVSLPKVDERSLKREPAKRWRPGKDSRGNDGEKPDKFSNVGSERKACVGSDMASMERDRPQTVDHRSPSFWKSLAAARWAPLDL